MTTLQITLFGDDIPVAPPAMPPRRTSAPLVRDGQAMPIGALVSGQARYERRCLVCGALLSLDEQPPRYPEAVCAACWRKRAP